MQPIDQIREIMIDHRELLKAYMAIVIGCEDHDYLGPHDAAYAGWQLSQECKDELQKIKEELEDNNPGIL